MNWVRFLPLQFSSAPRASPGGHATEAARESRSAPLHSSLALSEHWRAGASAVLLLVMVVLNVRWGVGPEILGGLVCAVACGLVAWRSEEDRLVWLALAVACAGLAAGASLAASGFDRMLRLGGFGLQDAGVFVFATSAAVGHLAWPEIRRSARRVVATLVDALIVVAAVALWGVAGFPPLGSVSLAVPGAAFAQSAELLLPLVTASLALPQVAPTRRVSGLALTAAMGSLFASDVLGNREVSHLAYTVGAAALLQGAGLILLFWAALTGSAGAHPRDLREDRVTQPPFLAPGLLGVVALALAVTTSPPQGPVVPLFASLVAGALGAREVVRLIERRRAQRQLATSLELEARLLDFAPSLPAEEAVRRSCNLAAEVLKANAALAWIAESSSLVLRATGPEPSPLSELIGRRVPLSDPESLAAQVVRTKAPEACEAEARIGPVDRFLATILGAAWLLGVPIVRQGTAIGAVVIVRAQGRPPFDEFDQQKAVLIAAQVASALHRIELHNELEHQLRETTLVHRFAVQVVAARTINDVAWQLLESMRSRFPFDRGSVYLADATSRGSFTPVAYFHTRVSDGPKGDSSAPSYLSVALSCGESRIGYIELQRGDGQKFNGDEDRVARILSQQAAVAIQNLRLQEESGKASTYRELDRLKTELLNAVSHDLRGPLSNIKAYAATLVEPGGEMAPDEQMLYLQTIEEEADRLRDLLDHLLDLSRIEAGQLHLAVQSVNVDRVVKQALSSLLSATAPPHHYETAIPDDLFATADGRRLRQVLHNLIENAVKYSPEGGAIRLSAAAMGSEVVISVSDEGVGIPRHQWDRIFRPYQRANTAVDRGIAGNGLGLALCKGIVEAHGGRIWVESEPSVGSTFSFTVPRSRGGE